MLGGKYLVSVQNKTGQHFFEPGSGILALRGSGTADRCELTVMMRSDRIHVARPAPRVRAPRCTRLVIYMTRDSQWGAHSVTSRRPSTRADARPPRISRRNR